LEVEVGITEIWVHPYSSPVLEGHEAWNYGIDLRRTM
jgi:hypothetical protein